MKGFSYTYIFAAVVALLVGYTIFDANQAEKSDAAKAEAEKVISVSPQDVTQIKVIRPDETMVIKQEKGSWGLVEPLTDVIEEEAARVYLDSMALEKASPVVLEKKGDINWANYNLSPPGVSVEITKADGGKISFSVSKLAAFDGSYFVRRGDELLLGSSGWAKIMEKGSAELRSKKVLRQPGTVTKLRIENSHPETKDKFTLIRKEDKSWYIQEAPDLEVDSEKVSKYIEDFKGLRALGFQTEKPDPANRKRYSLNSVVAKIVMDFEGNQPPWQIEVGAQKDGAHYGVSASIDAIFKLSAYDGDQMRRDRNHFRNGKVPFKFPMEQAGEIRVKSEANQWTFKKEGTSWKLADKADSTVDSANLEKLVEKISTLEAKDFFTAAKSPKVSGSKQVEFRAADGKPLLSVSFGDAFTPQAGVNKGSQMIYAKSSLTPETLAVAANDLNEIPFDQLVKSAANQQPEKQSEQR